MSINVKSKKKLNCFVKPFNELPTTLLLLQKAVYIKKNFEHIIYTISKLEKLTKIAPLYKYFKKNWWRHTYLMYTMVSHT